MYRAIAVVAVLMLLATACQAVNPPSVSESSQAEASASTPPNDEKALPLAVTLTRWNGSGDLSKTIIEGKARVGELTKLLDDPKPLADTDDEIQKRDGGTAMTAKIQDDAKTSHTVDIFYGTPQSLGYEVLVIRGETEKHYTDAQVFEALLQIIENDPQTEYFHSNP